MDLVDAAAFAAATRSPAALDALAPPSGGAIVVDARLGPPASAPPGAASGSSGAARSASAIDAGALVALPAVVVALTGHAGALPGGPGAPTAEECRAAGTGAPEGQASPRSGPGGPGMPQGQAARRSGSGTPEGQAAGRSGSQTGASGPGGPDAPEGQAGRSGPQTGAGAVGAAAGAGPDGGEWAWADVVVGDPGEAERVVAAVEANPVAATALVLHLRASAGLGVDAALVAESATYSLLQAGPEHRRWLAGRPAPRGGRDDRADERVRVTAGAGTLRITLTRPAVRNAVDAAMQRALTDALLVATADPGVRVVLDGAGPTFSAGGDLGEFGSLADPASAHVLRLARSPGRALARLADRTTAVVHGACHGAGVELPAFAGRVVARPGTTFTLPEVAMGLVPGAGGTVSLPRRIGRRRTAWLALTGHPLDAATALAWGLVDAVADPP